MAALPAGGVMIAIDAAEDEVLPLLTDRVSIAAINGPRSVVISGEEAAATDLAKQFRRSNRLKVSHAFHSPLIEPMLDEFRAVAGRLTYREPEIALISGLTGRSVTKIDAEYWVRHARDTVRFTDAVETLTPGTTMFLEIGPDAVLSRATKPAVSTTHSGQCLDRKSVV